MHVPNLTLRIITLICLALVWPTSVLAQERLAFSVSAENTKYTQQHTIDVGDVVGHQVRLFEIKRVYPANAPVIGGLKIVESWTRGISDYTNNTGEAVAYGVYVLDNGDNTRGRLVAFQSPEARKYVGHDRRTDHRRHRQAGPDQRHGTNGHISQSTNRHERNAD
jgi:hypothetical protein